MFEIKKMSMHDLAQPRVVGPLHTSFRPAALANREFRRIVNESGQAVPLVIGLERAEGQIAVYRTVCFSEDSDQAQLNLPYTERIVKFLLWQKGGWRVIVGGPRMIGEHISEVYSANGKRAFDVEIMERIYEHPFVVEITSAEDVPQQNERTTMLGGNLDGCRIGFDLGASDRKVSAVIDGEAVYTEEVIWNPRDAADPDYHFSEINAALKSASEHMQRVDAIGGSAAGTYIKNRPRVASLYRSVPKEQFDQKIGPLFANLQKEWGGVPFVVVNDGEVTALAGAMSIEDNSVLGIAMGSSEAGGYVSPTGGLTTCLNELAFCPIDYDPNGGVDEWSGDIGCGVQYLSQQAVFRLCKEAGIELDTSLGLAERLKSVQELLEQDDERAIKIWHTIGVYVGYAIAHYADFYEIKHVLVLGRVTSGKGGDILLSRAREVLNADFPEVARRVTMHLPDESSRRIGQAVAAASLPALR